MNKEYIFSEKEYAALIGLTKEGVRTRRRSGKLDGQFIKKEDKQYFYCRPERTEKKETQFRRRGVHKDGGQTNYPNEAFKKHNEKKILLKLQDQGEKKFESYLMDEKTWRAPKDVIEDPVFTSNLQKISPGRTGDIIEYEFMNIALKCGWEAFKNFSHNGPIDCILINPISAKAYYVDCKSVKTHNEAISQLIALRQKRGMYNIYIGYIFNGKAAIQYGENLNDKIILDPIKEVLSYHEHLKTGGLQEDYN
jgi:hypothetical protein|tara:strand:+ start:52 stop:804 length:753 start_codon:yes stop_codon:yes gene_type:complete